MSRLKLKSIWSIWCNTLSTLNWIDTQKLIRNIIKFTLVWWLLDGKIGHSLVLVVLITSTVVRKIATICIWSRLADVRTVQRLLGEGATWRLVVQWLTLWLYVVLLILILLLWKAQFFGWLGILRFLMLLLPCLGRDETLANSKFGCITTWFFTYKWFLFAKVIEIKCCFESKAVCCFAQRFQVLRDISKSSKIKIFI